MMSLFCDLVFYFFCLYFGYLTYPYGRPPPPPPPPPPPLPLNELPDPLDPLDFESPESKPINVWKLKITLNYFSNMFFMYITYKSMINSMTP